MESDKDTPNVSHHASYVEDDEVNLLDYYNLLKRHKRLIIIVATISTVVAIIAALCETNIYEARAVIAPVEHNAPSSMSSLVAKFGMAPSQSNVTEIVNLLYSNIVREKVIKEYNLLSVFFEKDALKDKSPEEKIWAGLRYLNGSLKIKQRDGVIELSMQSKDPKLAADVINYTLSELTNHMSSEAKRVAETNRKYLESRINDTSDPFIKTNIYSLIAQQIEQAMMAEVKENFAFKVIDPPRVPDMRIKPNRRQMVMLSFVASLFLGVFLAFLKEYIKKMKERGKEPEAQS